MKIKVLGSAAGGGMPQWNCNGRNSAGVRKGQAGLSPRNQASVAVSADGARWVLLNAAPDLRQQINDTPELHPAADGTIRVRNLEEFFAAQKGYFESGRAISERLENVRIEPGRRIARVMADFVFVDEGEERRGTLGLHLAEGQDGWRIVAILFSYDQVR